MESDDDLDKEIKILRQLKMQQSCEPISTDNADSAEDAVGGNITEDQQTLFKKDEVDCTCNAFCLESFGLNDIATIRTNYHAMDKETLDLTILGKLSVFMNREKKTDRSKERKFSYCNYMQEGKSS